MSADLDAQALALRALRPAPRATVMAVDADLQAVGWDTARFSLGPLALAEQGGGVRCSGGADVAAMWRKSTDLSTSLIDRMDERCGEFGFTLLSPRNPVLRGSHVSYAHPHAYAIIQALKERDVIGDFRAPDILRFGVTPLYLRHVDIIDAVEIVRDICMSGAWREPRLAIRAAVT